MENNQDKKVLLSLKDVEVKFNVRGRILTAIRRVSLDIYENENLAIVGESGSGKSVLTKTFAGMLDSNGFISNGSIIFSDDEISETNVKLDASKIRSLEKLQDFLNRSSLYERGAKEYVAIKQREQEIKAMQTLTPEEEETFSRELKTLSDSIVDKNNYIQTLDKHNAADQEEARKVTAEIKELTEKKEAKEKERQTLIRERKVAYKADAEKAARFRNELTELKAAREEKIKVPQTSGGNPYGLSDEIIERNKVISYEIELSIGRYPYRKRVTFMRKLKSAIRLAMMTGEDLFDPEVRNRIFDPIVFRVEYRYVDRENDVIHGYAIIDCAKVKYSNDWQQIRGKRIATVFQDPMTSLNPVITIGKQIMTVILKHQKCSQAEARERTLDIMAKVGIPEPESRFDDYPFEYSGGMRQRIVIAIALSCQPKILICDEPTTALDVTIQAQILRLIKDLQKDLGFTTVYITHDLGVVANVAERVAVLYGGQIVEIGTVEDIFYEPKHPYTWALLSSLPQLTEKGQELFSIAGTPPSLYNKIKGDAFAPRNKYAMAIDLEEEPPMFKVSDTHYAKTWLLDPRAPKTDMPENIRNLHEKMAKSFYNIGV